VPNPRLPVFDQTSPLRPERFGHIVLKTARRDEMSRWYQRFLHAEVMFEGGIGTFLTYDEEHHRVFLLNAPNAVDRHPDAAGLAHFAYLYGSLTDLLTTYERLAKEGVTPGYCVNHGFQLSFYYLDPDGNEVELGCDCFAGREELDAWFAEGLFAVNPFGYPVDPQRMLERHRAGVPDADLLQDTYR
jgi:catechol-2,3-dioxygenase